MIGYDGIAFAQAKTNENVSFTRKHLLLAVAAKVPQNGKLVDNPYKTWNQIDASLPNREIIIYGPPTSSGTRDAFEELVMEKLTKKMAGYGKKKYHTIRQDGVYIPSGENDNLIVQKLERNKNAFGIFGYSFLAENSDKILAAKVDGKLPTPQTIADGSYPVSRSLFFYIKKSHLDKVKAMQAYIDMFMSEEMVSEDGVLKTIGLIPMAKKLRFKVQSSVKNLTPLTLKMVKSKKISK